MSATLKYAFRITHIRNISHINKFGIVRANSPFRNQNYVNIGDSNVIDARATRIIKGYNLNEYIPFYFGPRSPMLYVIQNGYNGVTRVEPADIVYCVIRLNDIMISQLECIFTDGHALNGLTNFYTKEQLYRINTIVNYDDVYASRWNLETDLDLKRRKEAELLIKDDLAPGLVCGYVVYNTSAKQQMQRLGIDENKIIVNAGYYF